MKTEPPKPLPAKNFAPGFRALVVDDNVMNARLASAFLVKFGCTVDTAEDGVAGLACALAKKYDLILMDCHMPRMNGFECTEQIKRALGADCPRIVALTGSTDPEDLAACARVGMDGVMIKPLTAKKLEELLAGLPAWLENKAG